MIVRNDAAHARAAAIYPELLQPGRLVTHNYVVLEAIALLHRRVGVAGVRVLLDELLPSLEVHWIERDVHDTALSTLLAAGRRKASFVDWISFEMMRREGIEQAFAFDRDFAAQGFESVP